MALPAEVARLIEMFEQNREDYLQGRYSETQLRREYIDPFFKAPTVRPKENIEAACQIRRYA